MGEQTQAQIEEQTGFKIDINNDYYIVADDKQYILRVKKKKEAGARTKDENVGEEYYQNVAYFTSFKDLLKFIPEKIIRKNTNISNILDKLNEINESINKIAVEPIKIKVKVPVKEKGASDNE